MIQRLKQLLFWGVMIGAFYGLLAHHIIIIDFQTYRFLKKKELTLVYTFYFTKDKKIADILQVETLVEAGIKEVLLETGIIPPGSRY
jgi:hypothetical protein